MSKQRLSYASVSHPRHLAIKVKSEKELAGPLRPNQSLLKEWRLVLEGNSQKTLEMSRLQKEWIDLEIVLSPLAKCEAIFSLPKGKAIWCMWGTEQKQLAEFGFIDACFITISSRFFNSVISQ